MATPNYGYEKRQKELAKKKKKEEKLKQKSERKVGDTSHDGVQQDSESGDGGAAALDTPPQN